MTKHAIYSMLDRPASSHYRPDIAEYAALSRMFTRQDRVYYLITLSTRNKKFSYRRGTARPTKLAVS